MRSERRLQLELKVRTGTLEQGPPLQLGALLGVMHGHDGDVATTVGFLGLGLEGAAGRGHAVVDEDDGLGRDLHGGDEGAEKLDGVFVGEIPEHVAEDEGEGLAGVGGGLWGEHVPVGVFDSRF